MPRVEFSEKNVKKNDYDYPKFKLERKGELARVAILEAPVAEFVHNLRKPKLTGGIPEKEIKTRRDGGQYEDYKYEFVGRPICLGDYGILTEEGSDPEHCPVCAEARRSDRFTAPQRRFALHLVRYETRANSTEVKEPFSARTEVYSFTDKVFGELFGFKQQGFDLRKHDVIFKSENPSFHGYNLQISMDAAWRANEERQQYVKELLKPENLAPDLSIFCGSRKSEKSIEFDIRAINEAWDIATGVRSVSPQDAALSGVGTGNLVESLDSLLSSGSENKDSNDEWFSESSLEAATSLDDLGLGDNSAPAESSDEKSDDDEINALLNL